MTAPRRAVSATGTLLWSSPMPLSDSRSSWPGGRRPAHPRRSVAAATLGVVTVLAGGAAAAAPATVSAAPIGDPAVWSVTTDGPVVAGVPARIQLRGDASGTEPADPEADTDPAVGLGIVPPGVGCPGSYAELTGTVFGDSWHWVRGDGTSQPFHKYPSVLFDVPGSYAACGYYGLEGFLSLDDDPDATTVQYQPYTVVVQRPTVDVDLVFDGPPVGGRAIRLTGIATANAPQTVTIHLNPADLPCAATAQINEPHDRFAEGPEPFALYGGPRPIAVAVGLPTVGGAYRTCIYAHRDGQDGDPDLAVSGPSIVIDAPPPAPPLLPPAGPPTEATVPPVQVLPPVLPVDTSELTPVVTTEQPISCTVNRVAVRRGTTVAIRCPRASGTIGVRLRRAGNRPLQTSTLKLQKGIAQLRTSRLSPGAWSSVVIYRGRSVGTVQLVVRGPRPKGAARKRSTAESTSGRPRFSKALNSTRKQASR